MAEPIGAKVEPAGAGRESVNTPQPDAAPPEARNYAGGCHCGKVRYQARTDLGMVIACNCSLCAKRGWLLSFVPAAAFTLERGEDALTSYQFNKHIIHHLFCSACGTQSFARGTGPDGREMVAINVRCLDDVDLTALTITSVDGRSA